MALNYPGYAVPQPTDLTLLDVYGEWNKGVEKGKADRYEREAPDQFANAAAPLSEYGLSTPPDQLKAMFANPETRPMAMQMVQEATQRRADASDPMKQLQLKKMQLDVAAAQRGPAGPGPTAEMRNWQQAQSDPKFAEFIGANGLRNAPDVVKQYAYYRDQAIAAGEQPIGFLEFKNYTPTEAPKPQTDLAKLKADLQAGLITPEQYNTAAANTLASGAPKPEQPLTSLAKLKADLDAGRITPDQYNAVVAKETASNNGTSLRMNPQTGDFEFQQGGPATGMPKLTEGQGKDVGFATRMSGALPTIDALGDHLTEFVGDVANKVPYGNYLQSDDYQQAQQAGDEFLTGLLRKDSGGAITQDEKATYGKTYLPQPGDKPGVLKQKKSARKRALKAIELGLPAAAVLQMEREGIVIPDLNEGSKEPAADGAAPPADWQGSPDLWNYLTPEERALWQN